MSSWTINFSWMCDDRHVFVTSSFNCLGLFRMTSPTLLMTLVCLFDRLTTLTSFELPEEFSPELTRVTVSSSSTGLEGSSFDSSRASSSRSVDPPVFSLSLASDIHPLSMFPLDVLLSGRWSRTPSSSSEENNLLLLVIRTHRFPPHRMIRLFTRPEDFHRCSQFWLASLVFFQSHSSFSGCGSDMLPPAPAAWFSVGPPTDDMRDVGSSKVDTLERMSSEVLEWISTSMDGMENHWNTVGIKQKDRMNRFASRLKTIVMF